jgi:hypothetical protein
MVSKPLACGQTPLFGKGAVASGIKCGRTAALHQRRGEYLSTVHGLCDRPATPEAEDQDRGECNSSTHGIDDLAMHSG